MPDHSRKVVQSALCTGMHTRARALPEKTFPSQAELCLHQDGFHVLVKPYNVLSLALEQAYPKRSCSVTCYEVQNLVSRSPLLVKWDYGNILAISISCAYSNK